MWDYSEKVKEHFYNPRNAGAVHRANATGDVGSISCGDALRLTLRVNAETEVIEDAGFQTFGCGSAIASSSALTEMIKGMTLNQALDVSNQDIADYLDGLPPEKMHCSVMGREALRAAIADYRGEILVDDHEEGALVCKCFAVDEVLVRDMIRSYSLSSVEDVTHYTKAGGGCSSCHEKIELLLTEELEARGELFVAAPIQAKNKAKKPSADLQIIQLDQPHVESISLPNKMTSVERIRRIEAVIETIRPNLLRDHGDIELIEVEGKNIYVKLVGNCTGCQMANMTIGGIQQKLMEDLGSFVKVIPVSPN